MQFFITILTLVLMGIAFFAIKFIQEESQDQKRKEQKNNELIADLETKLKKTQEELTKEKSERQEIENLLYKTKDELDNFKNQNSELSQRVRELSKKEEAAKQDSIEREKLKPELETARKQLEQLRKDKDILQKELESVKKDFDPLKGEVEPLRKENEDLKNQLKFLEEIQEGLKGQYDELSKQLEEINQQRISGPSGDIIKEDKKQEAGTAKQGAAIEPKKELPAGSDFQQSKDNPDNSNKIEINKPIEQKQEKPPSGSPENKPKI